MQKPEHKLEGGERGKAEAAFPVLRPHRAPLAAEGSPHWRLGGGGNRGRSWEWGREGTGVSEGMPDP